MKGEANMEQNDAEIKKALEYCVIGDCFRCPLYYVHNCRTQLREGTNNILNKQYYRRIINILLSLSIVIIFFSSITTLFLNELFRNGISL